MFKLPADRVICRTESTTLSIDSTDMMVLWSNGSTAQTISTDHEGWYWAEVTDGTCLMRDSTLVSYTPTLPPLSLGDSVVICEDQIMMLDVSAWKGNYLWSTGSTWSEFVVADAGTYSVIVDNGCDRVTDEIVVERQSKCCDIYFPNVFTPNGDRLNDVFEITTESNIATYEFKVYNIWGQLVFQTDNPLEFWMGNHTDQSESDNGIYYWTARYKCAVLDKTFDKEVKGIVSVVK
ncbi:MAG TPA: gliding motility-associated C-terminal domain-containing protein [Chryseolinea sp.]|nr:gliding motility-associated C-terminal domain-containing protein [Chryseolinea sp.]